MDDDELALYFEEMPSEAIDDKSSATQEEPESPPEPKKKRKRRTVEIGGLTWYKTPKKGESLATHHRTWSTVCGRYFVRESRSKYGLPTAWYAFFGDFATILSRHRKRGPAEQSCALHAKDPVRWDRYYGPLGPNSRSPEPRAKKKKTVKRK